MTVHSSIKKLKTYFKNRDDVLMAFLFGSRAKGISAKRSDWDIGVYLKPKYGFIAVKVLIMCNVLIHIKS